jgi:DNA-binding NarL/FixJ family response regulator
MPRVLVVDDHPDFRLLVRLALEPTPFQVVRETSDGRGAVEAAAECRPDLVLLDCAMPGSDAFDALPGLRRVAPGCRVILMSGYPLGELRLAARSAGTLGFLSKDTAVTRLGDELVVLAGVVDAVEGVLVQASAQLASDARSPGTARRFVAQLLEPWHLGPLLDTVTLLVSELVTNAVVHAGADVGIVVRLTEQAARVEVSDPSNLPLSPGTPELAWESGRGLWMVATMARAWGVRRHPGGGKAVWFEVDRDPVDPARAGEDEGRGESGGGPRQPSGDPAARG